MKKKFDTLVYMTYDGDFAWPVFAASHELNVAVDRMIAVW